MHAIARFVLRHKALVAVVWGTITIVSIVSTGPASKALSAKFEFPGSESTRVNAAIIDRFGNGGSTSPEVAVVTLPANTTVDSPGVRDALTRAFARVTARAPGTRIVSYASTGARIFVSSDGRTTYGLIYPRPGDGPNPSPDVPAIKNALAGATVAGAHFQITGFADLQSGGSKDAGNSGVLVETLVGGIGALIVLIWVFGSYLAILPILMAAVSIVTAFLLVWGLTTVTDVNFLVQLLISLIGLGVAIDYSLLVVTRWREERAAGHPNDVAVQRAIETAGHSVVFSGTTVAIGLLALVALPVPFLRSIGYAGLLIPLVSVVVAITLLPVVLATVGPRLDWPRARRGSQVSHLWECWTSFVIRRRWAAAAVALTILVALLIPALSIRIGQPSADALAQSGAAAAGYRALEQAGIPPGAITPFEVLVQGSDPAHMAQKLAGVKGVAGAIAPDGPAWREGDTAILVVIPSVDGNSPAGRAVLGRVRDTAHGMPGEVQVGGPPAREADFIDSVYSNVPLMIGLIVLVTFVLLVHAFRSLLLPLKALILNIVSVGAAYGVLVLVWQDGHGSEQIWGVPSTGSITNWLPVAVFAFLFGLSMDYEVFILARIREEYDATGSTNRAIVRGMSLTGRLVTSAAVILFLAFVSLAATPNTHTKIMATGLATGILLDAVVIRALLVPATVSLMGHWNWWLPGWLRWLVPQPEPVPVPVTAQRDRPPFEH